MYIISVVDTLKKNPNLSSVLVYGIPIIMVCFKSGVKVIHAFPLWLI